MRTEGKPRGLRITSVIERRRHAHYRGRVCEGSACGVFHVNLLDLFRDTTQMVEEAHVDLFLSKRPRPDGAAIPPLTVSIIRIRAALALSLPTSAGSQRSGAFHSFVPSIHFHGGY